MARARGAYRMTPKRRAALRKAQAASARKRRGRNRKIAVGVAAGVGVGAVLGAGVYRHKASGSSLGFRTFDQKALVAVSRRTTSSNTGAPKRGITGVEKTNRISFGTKLTGSVEVSYRHRTIAANRKIQRQALQNAQATVMGRRTGKVNRAGIPKYNPDSKKNWPNKWVPQDDEKYQPATRWEEAMLGKKIRSR